MREDKAKESDHKQLNYVATEYKEYPRSTVT